MKEAKGGSKNSIGIPLIDTDCYSLKTLLIPGFREKEQRCEEKNGGGGVHIRKGVCIKPFGKSVPLKYLSQWGKREGNAAGELGEKGSCVLYQLERSRGKCP